MTKQNTSRFVAELADGTLHHVEAFTGTHVVIHLAAVTEITGERVNISRTIPLSEVTLYRKSEPLEPSPELLQALFVAELQFLAGDNVVVIKGNA